MSQLDTGFSMASPVGISNTVYIAEGSFIRKRTQIVLTPEYGESLRLPCASLSAAQSVAQRFPFVPLRHEKIRH